MIFFSWQFVRKPAFERKRGDRNWEFAEGGNAAKRKGQWPKRDQESSTGWGAEAVVVKGVNADELGRQQMAHSNAVNSAPPISISALRWC